MSKRVADTETGTAPAKRADPVLAPVSLDLMRVYYKEVFPTKLLFRWLSYKNDPDSKDEDTQQDYFARRELTMNLPGDIYIRWQSFETHSQFRAAVIEKQPARIEIGAVYSFAPKLHVQQIGRQFTALERELVFDIDMDDYDEIRTCCSKANVCARCWRWMSCAIEILGAALRDDFGFEHVMFVFSGRRGVHAWVCDAGARVLENQVRSAVAEYMNFIVGGAMVDQKVKLWASKGQELHPAASRAIAICERNLTCPGGILDTQEFLVPGHPKLGKVLQSLPVDISKAVRAELEATPKGWTTRRVYDLLGKHLTAPNAPRHTMNELKIELAYPRLDIAVTKGVNHLLKAPFCVHPKSGKVCVPIFGNPAAFNPEQAPTLRGIVDSMNEKRASPLAPYLNSFQKWVDRLTYAVAADRKENSERNLEF